MSMSINIRRFKEYYGRYERIFIPGALLLGVIVDFVTFKSIAIGTSFLILGGHVVIVGASIFFMQWEKGQKGEKGQNIIRLFSPLTFQFSLGALLSASFIFYWFSGAFSISWPILGALGILMASNEVFRRSFQKPVVQLSVFYFALFSLGTLIFPYTFNTVDVSMFILSGFTSMGIITLYILFLSRVSDFVRLLRPHLAIGVLLVFTFMNAMYFLNVIPPIPLSLREAGVYHAVNRVGAQYQLIDEQTSFIDRLLPGQSIHMKKGERLYMYTAIFAPAKLTTPIFHQWQFYDRINKKWMNKDRLSFRISGGRDRGYRGYTLKTGVQEGKWRVRVETQTGQVLGRVGFTVRHVVEDTPTISVIK